MKPWEIDYSTAEVKPNNQNVMPWEIDYSQPDFSKAKPQNIFSIDGENTNAPKKADSWWKSIINQTKENFQNVKKGADKALSINEAAGKSAASSYSQMIGVGGGSLIGAIGDQIVDKSDAIAKAVDSMPYAGYITNPLGLSNLLMDMSRKMIVDDETAESLNIEKKTQDKLNSFGQTLQKGSAILYKLSDIAEKDLKLDDKIFEGSILENPSAERFAAIYGSIVPSIVSMKGIHGLGKLLFGAKGSNAFTYISMGGLSAGDIYKEAKEKGIDIDKSLGLYTASWASNSILERLFDPIERVFGAKISGNSIPKQIAKRVFGGMLESGTEISQSLSTNVIKKYGGINETQDLLEGLIESAVGGFIGGGVFAGSFNEKNQALLNKGMSQNEIDMFMDAAGQYVSQNADEINDFAFQKITEGLSTFEKFIEEHAGTPEAQKAIQTKKDLEFVGNEVYNMLKKSGRTEESAKRESQILQGIALWGAEETGLSPIEFIKKRFPEVRQMKFKEFQEQFVAKKERAGLNNVNLFEAVLNPTIRNKIAQAEKQKNGASLLQFIKQRGGIKDVEGDLKAMDAGKLYIGLINNKDGQSIDDVALAAWENGYFPDKMERPDIDELKGAIRDELFGEKRYAFQHGKESVLKDIQDLEQTLDMLDIDYSNMSATELETAFNEAVNKYNAENNKVIEEDDNYNEDDYIPFQQSMDIAKQNEELDKVNPAYEGETININGVEKTVYNSNGERIAMSEPALRNFYNWFGDSKVVDEQGRPLVVYHGSDADFDVFDRTKTRSTMDIQGNFFSPWELDAQGYGSNVRAFYLKITNPANSSIGYKALKKYQGQDHASVKAREELERMGYDGVNNDDEEFISFSPNQIKSTTNRGTFSKDSDNIYYQTIWAKKTDVTTKSNPKQMRADAEKYLKNIIKKQNIKHPQLGKIRVSNKGISEFIHATGNLDKLALVPHLKELIETSIVGKKEALTHKRTDGIVAFYPLYNNAIIDGISYDVTTKIGVDENGNLFYTILMDEKNSSIDSNKETKSEPIDEAINVIISQSDTDVKPQFQSAYAGSRVDYDTPSLEAIGSGEGAQVHGWGLYYSLSKDVAEGYREKFTKKEAVESTKYKGKSLYDLYSENDFDTYTALTLLIKEDFNLEETIKEQKRIMEYFKTSIHYDEDIYKEYEDVLKKLQEIDISDIEQPTGQVHEVDIPENPYLLDEDATFFEQPEIVQKGLKNIVKELSDEQISREFEGDIHPDNRDVLLRMWKFEDYDFNNSGGSIYKSLSKMLGSDKEASLLLEKHGIKGITYEGRRDGRCFVIFNPNDVKVIQKFYQNVSNSTKGAYFKDIIYLFETADASTFMHETAHWFKGELKKFGSEKSALMLKKVDEWENEEFINRYSVDLDKGRYVVKNKMGGIIYDQNFQTAEDAKDYAKNELFARGFEAYLKEGKAPNSYLKQAFKSFANWLRHLYRGARKLNVSLNDNIRGVYSNILGGTDLDFYLNAPTIEFIAQRRQYEKDRVQSIESEIERAQIMERRRKVIPFANFRDERNESKKDGVKWWGKAMIPISTRAKRITPKLRNRLRQYDFNVLQELKRQYEVINPFYQKWQLMNSNDIIAFDFALKNGHGELQEKIVNKYGAQTEFKAVKNLLEEIYAQAKNVGIDMGHQIDYFPREISDLDGLMTYLHGSEMASDFRRAAKEADFRSMTDEEKATFINKYLRGYERTDLVTPPPGNVKDRRIDIITAEINQFYKPSSQALFSYIDRMTNTIESRKFFGKDVDSIEDSIGAFIDELIENGEITAKQDQEVENILKARFKQKGVSNKFLIYQRNMSYLYTMGGINSAITQLSDLATAMYKGGVFNTAKAIFGEKVPELSKQSLGLEKIGQEFIDVSTSSKAVEKIFKLTGLNKIDEFGKNILLQSSYLKFKDMAQNDPEKLKALIEPIMEQNTNETVADLAEGKITDNIKFLMFNELADVQPITLSEMPEGYLLGGNWRIMYMLKTFAVKRIDTFRNECFDKIRSKEPEQVKEGLQNLFRLAMLMMLCGAAKDVLIDLLYGRQIILKDTVINNALGLFGVTKYQMYKAREDGWSGFASSFIPPVFAIWSDLGRDMADDFLTVKGKDLKDYEVLKGAPILGRFYYWWFGGGRTKEENKKNKKLR